MSDLPKENFFKKVVDFFKVTKSEFGKIVWPSKETTTKNVLTVLGVTAVLGAILAGLDAGFQYLIINLFLGNQVK